MSTPTVRRIKPHGGGGGTKITAPPPKTLTPLSAGKENPNPNAPIQKPIQKPSVPQMPRFTRSNSAAPKGRSSSPFEFTRALSDMRKNQGFGARESGKVERSVSSGRRSVSGGRVFDRCQPKTGSLRDLNVKSGERVEKISFGVKNNNVVLRDSNMKSGERIGRNELALVKSGEIFKKNEGVFSTSRQKNGVLSDSSAKLGERVGMERSESGSKGSGDSASRVLGRSEPKNRSLNNSYAKLGETVEKLNENISSVEVGIAKNGDICQNESGIKVSDDFPVRGLKEKKSIASGERFKSSVKDECKSEDGLSSNLSNSRPDSSDSDVKRRHFRNLVSIEREKRVNYTKDSDSKMTKALSDSERLKQKGLVEENVSAQSVNKYPSKLHEKLAFLEGKVKRIASDIKRTKDMLDLNNPDSSKVILSDIQEKISGIEKAMGNVNNSDKQINVLEKVETKEKISENGNVIGSAVNRVENVERKDMENVKIFVNGLNSDEQINVLENVETKDNFLGSEKAIGNVVNGDKQNNGLEKVERKELENEKSSVKGLNSEELEARLFPHHKLLRNRTSSKVSSTSGEKMDLEVGQKLSNRIDELPLVKDQNKVTVRGEKAGCHFSEVQETDGAASSKSLDNVTVVGMDGSTIDLTTDEILEGSDEQCIKSEMVIGEEIEDNSMYQFNEVGRKTATGGWFVAEGEAALIAHDDGSCTYYDITNSEVKSEYKPPVGISPNMWRDCWIVRAPGADGSSDRYVVAASAGNTLELGFCSWDFYDKDVKAFHIENETNNNSRTALAPLPNPSHQRNSFSSIIASENRQWWYKPCGPLIASTATNQKGVSIYDIRDGEQIMKWDVQKPVLSMDHSSPLQWRNRGKVVIAETECVSLWDVSSQTPQALQSISTSGRRVCALHVSNTDAEFGGGVRQRVSSSEAEGNDGVFCTADSINVLDLRLPSGVGLKISKIGINTQSVFSRGDSIYLGCTNPRPVGKIQACSQIQHFSLRKQKLVSFYSFPDSNAHPHYTTITQVWGNSDFVMGVSGLGLFVFDALEDKEVKFLPNEFTGTHKVRETIGPDDSYSPSFDYLSSRVLLISRDRPALWRHLV